MVMGKNQIYFSLLFKYKSLWEMNFYDVSDTRFFSLIVLPFHQY
jgi:hypothetical protein